MLIGLICALLLMILDVPLPAIEYDYALSDEALVSEREERLIEIHEIGLSDEWADTHPQLIASLDKHLNATYGGLNGYLDGIDFGAEERAKVHDALLY